MFITQILYFVRFNLRNKKLKFEGLDEREEFGVFILHFSHSSFLVIELYCKIVT